MKINFYQKAMVARQINVLKDLANKKTVYILGANYESYEYTDPARGFDCASCAMYGIEKAVEHEVLCGNQNVIEDEAKKDMGIFKYVDEDKVIPGDLCIVNYPSGNKYDMKPYAYNGIWYPNPADHVLTVIDHGETVDTGYDDSDHSKVIIKKGEYRSSMSFYRSLGATLKFVRPDYNIIRRLRKEGGL